MARLSINCLGWEKRKAGKDNPHDTYKLVNHKTLFTKPLKFTAL